MAVWRGIVQITSPFIGGIGTNTWHCRTASSPPLDQADLASVTDALETFYQTIQSHMAHTTTFIHDGVWTRVEADQDQAQEDIDGWSVIAGNTNPLPPANALVVGWRAAAGGRSGRGRTFVGPLGITTLQDNGTPNETNRDAIEGAAETLIGDAQTLPGVALGIWSPKDQVLRDFVSASVANKFSVLRSRRD